MKEEWKNIEGYEGLYKISNLGNVMSVKRYVNSSRAPRIVKTKLLKPTSNGNGYLIVGLRKNAKRKNYYVHRLVAKHFLDNWNENLMVDHIDYNRNNNELSNLRLLTQKDNIAHSIKNMKKEHKSWKGNKEKYIYRRHGKYRVSVKGKKEKLFKNYCDALKYREGLLNERLA